VTDRRRIVPSLALGCCLAVSTGACEASDDGTALLRNDSGRTDLEVVVLDGAGRAFREGALEPAFRFDTQFTDRERQCLEAGDGSFEIREPDGTVVVRHDFAEHAVCERDVLEISRELQLVWRSRIGAE
jgi:hypothetical protein